MKHTLFSEDRCEFSPFLQIILTYFIPDNRINTTQSMQKMNTETSKEFTEEIGIDKGLHFEAHDGKEISFYAVKRIKETFKETYHKRTVARFFRHYKGCMHVYHILHYSFIKSIYVI